MKTRVVATTIIMTGLLFCPALSRADRHYKVQNGPDRFYYGHISLVDAAPGGPTPVVRREGSPVPEEAVVNLPLAPGDTVRTPPGSRCEIQFDTGTIVRLDSETELGIGTVLAPSLSAGDRLSNLVLARGLIYVMYKRYDRSEMFQVLTPNAAVKFRHQTVAIVQAGEHSTDVQVNSGKASVLFGADERDLQQRNVGRLGRLIVTGEKETQEASWTPGTEFELWNKDVNARFEELHEGLSALPKPIQNLPEAVFYFAQAYGNRYGEWLWDDLYGYVWRPYLNDNTYPWGWGPYIYGRWSVVDGQMFWVPGEPWGWVPYHLGIWQWDKKLGWVWLPGSLFASAQVQWDFYFGYASWHARTLFDWLNWELFDGFGSSIPSWYLDYYSSGWSLWSAGYGAGHPYRSNPGSQAANWKPVLDKINLRQLKQPDTSSNGMPKEIKKVFERVTAALKQGNPRVLESLTDGPSHIVVVRKGDLGAPAIQARRVDPGRVPRLDLPRAEQGMDAGRRGVSARQQAVRVFLGGRTLPEEAPAPPAPRIEGPRRDTGANPGAVRPPIRGTGAGPASSSSSGVGTARVAGQPRDPAPWTTVPGPAGRRAFLDWNPDIRAARDLGVHIEYSSSANEVLCPELNLRSSHPSGSIAGSQRISPNGQGAPSPGSLSGAPGGSPSSSGPPTGAGQTQSKGSNDKGGGQTASRGGGGTVKH